MSVKSHNPRNILVVAVDPERSEILQRSLHNDGYCVTTTLTSSESLIEQVVQHQPDALVIALDSPGRAVMGQLQYINQKHPCPTVIFTKDEDPHAMNQAIKAGVSAYIVNGLDSSRIKAIMDVAVVRFHEYQSLREELAQTRDTLETRMLIDRAKALLIKHQGMSESQAYQALRKLSMDQGKKLGEVARNVIAVMEFLQ